MTTAVFGLGAMPAASATSNIQAFGIEETLKDFNGPLIGYTVSKFMPSSDPVAYPVAGRLYEATVMANAIQGTVVPTVFFNARAESGQNYRVLESVSTIGGPIGPGGSSTGKIYFDVVGDTPNSVVFNDGGEDILGWVMPPGVGSEEVAPPAGGGGSGGGDEGSMGSTGPNEASPNTTGGDQGGTGGVEGADPGGGGLGGATGSSNAGGGGAGG